MNSIHDMGGCHGMGEISREHNEPFFHEKWEARLFACQFAMNAWGSWSLDRVRWFREQMPGPLYLNSKYYEIWLDALIRLIIDAGFASANELKTGICEDNVERYSPALKPDSVKRQMLKGISSRRENSEIEQRFSPGVQVRALNINPKSHTRLPRYVRGKCGVVEARRGVFVFPDTNSQGLGEKPQTVYSVCFKPEEIWGPGHKHQNDLIYVDMWENYLEKV